MQRNNNTILLLTVLLGLVAIGGAAFLFLRPAAPPPPPEAAAVAVVQPTPTPSSVLVATRTIPPRTTITPDMVRTSFVRTNAPDDAISSIVDTAGLITQKQIRAGEPVRKSAFTTPLDRAILANFQVPSGTRAVAIWVDPKTTAAGLVDVGDRVDVVVTNRLSFEKTDRQYVVGTREFTSGRTIGRNLLVLAVDRSLDAIPTPVPTPAPAPGVPAGPPPPPPPPTPAPATPPAERTRVILAAAPATAATLVAANELGKLTITIRNPLDADAGPVPEVREYPSRLLTRPQPRQATVSTERVTTVFPAQPPLPEPSTQTPPFDPPSGPMGPPSFPAGDPNANGTSAPPAPATQDVMVIRGTEKARVTVPQR